MSLNEQNGKRAAAEVDASKEVASSDSVLPTIRLWQASLGISALLALFGFIVKIAQEHFLGISLMQWGPAELSTTSGRWLIDTVLLVCQVCMNHPLWATVWAILVLASVVISSEFPQTSTTFRASRGIVVVLVVISLSIVLMQVQLPLTTVDGWLTTNLEDRFPTATGGDSSKTSMSNSVGNECILSDPKSPNTSTPACKPVSRIPLTSRYFHDKQLYFNQKIFLSKAANVGRCVTANPKGLPGQLRGLVSNPDNWPQQAEDAERSLQDYYVLEIACCLGAWIVIYLQRPSLVERSFDKAIDVTTLVLSFFLLPFCSLLVPYSYGKLIGSSEFTKATVQQQLGVADKNGPYFLIERSDSLISVLSLIAGVPKVTVIRNDQVASMELFGKVDVLKSWNDECWFNPVALPPPAGPPATPQPAPVSSTHLPGD